jgi:putative transposase
MLTSRYFEVLAPSNVEEVTIYAIKRELKLNNKEKRFFAGCAGFSRFVYDYGLSVLKATWYIPEISKQ